MCFRPVHAGKRKRAFEISQRRLCLYEACYTPGKPVCQENLSADGARLTNGIHAAYNNGKYEQAMASGRIPGAIVFLFTQKYIYGQTGTGRKMP